MGSTDDSYQHEPQSESPIASYAAWLKTAISSYEVLAKRLVAHNAEKGRIVEAVVKTALRSILPGRFSFGTGFVITPSGRSSPQLDLVIYDGVMNAPIVLEGGVGLFPAECVYGFVEVKSNLDGRTIEKTIDAIAKVRSLGADKVYSNYGSKEKGPGQYVVEHQRITIRCW